jgi:hypothetical protein
VVDVQVDENTGVVAEPDADTFVDAWQRADIDGLVALGGDRVQAGTVVSAECSWGVLASKMR